MRRQHLAQMLAAENEQYAQEILSMAETPDDVKSRMEARAKQLKDASAKQAAEVPRRAPPFPPHIQSVI